MDAPFSRVLIANRGEIAVRIARTLRRLGVSVATVHSDADRDALHVRVADVAVGIGPAPSAQSYLRADAIVDAARSVGAQAVHPGYGFLSERAELAERCVAAGLVFVGPPAAAMDAMGDKIRARRTVAAAGVPVVPGFDGPGVDDDALVDASTEIGFPVLVKPSAGGGGKGMRVARDVPELRAALRSARREAAAAFGDDTMLLERYVARPRHVEVQVLCDAHGGAVHLGERECSLQRRHQKIVEEAPSPIITPERRARWGALALEAARAVGYVNAGTVELIVPGDDPDQAFFLEMNTRLQVEHPVTEMVWDVDLVAEQLWIAAGEPLRLRQADLAPSGHAVEARLYAEDPATGFLPSPGPVRVFHVPDRSEVSGAVVRVDTGVASGDRVESHYDPMMAKVIVHAPDRSTALDAMDQVLAGTVVAGVANNVGFLRRLLSDPDVRAGDLDTGLVDRSGAADTVADDHLAVAAALALEELAAEGRDPADPWQRLGGWRLGAPAWTHHRLRIGERHVVVRTRGVGVDRRAHTDPADPVDVAAALAPDRGPIDRARHVDVRIGDRRDHLVVVPDGDLVWAVHGGQTWAVVDAGVGQGTHRSVAESSSVVTSPMPGTVVSVEVAEGADVAEGDPVVVVEAMKMEHTLRAPFPARVERVLARVGDRVSLGAELVHLDPTAPADHDASRT